MSILAGIPQFTYMNVTPVLGWPSFGRRLFSMESDSFAKPGFAWVIIRGPVWTYLMPSPDGDHWTKVDASPMLKGRLACADRKETVLTTAATAFLTALGACTMTAASTRAAALAKVVTMLETA